MAIEKSKKQGIKEMFWEICQQVLRLIFVVASVGGYVVLIYRYCLCAAMSALQHLPSSQFYPSFKT